VRTGTELGELVLNAVILTPPDGAVLPGGRTLVAGWVISPPGAPVERVEVSVDDGRTWRPANFFADLGPWAWRHWQATFDLAPGRHTLVARAVTRDGATQPAELAEVWNVKGYANNAWHRVTVTVSG
jgi:sulfite oxidase